MASGTTAGGGQVRRLTKAIFGRMGREGGLGRDDRAQLDRLANLIGAAGMPNAGQPAAAQDPERR
jgi:hypothetical protein